MVASTAVCLLAATGRAATVDLGSASMTGPATARGSWVSLGAFGPGPGQGASTTSATVLDVGSSGRPSWMSQSVLPGGNKDIAPAVHVDLDLLPACAKDPARRRSAHIVDRHISLGAMAPQGGASTAPGATGEASSWTSGDGAAASEGDQGTLNYEGKKVAAASTKYFQDFEDGQTPREWEVGRISEYNEFGRFAGPFRNTMQTLYVQCEPEEPYAVEFDLLFIAASLGDPAASDQFQVLVDGQPMLSDRFLELEERNQKLNGDRPDFNPSIFRRLSVLFTPKGNGIVTIQFVCNAAGLPGGETWGLDNVHIDKAPKQTLGELGGGPSGGAAGGGRFMQLAGGNSPDYSPPRSYQQGDTAIRPPHPESPRNEDKPAETPAPGTGLVMIAAGLGAMRRRRPR